ncbi:DUF4350 domain-containing protein [Halorubrum kocurii]|uniref:DUF4350 domain-containing protein n=1 Tax=Halorubrum kocurii TaxID=478441 RepID=UPI0013755BD3|nr:DUF4350 domain-containing protein [Halorubrum kocurii]
MIAASTSGAAFGAYNPAWDGTADLRDTTATHSETIVSLDGEAYTTDQPDQTLAVVLAPTTPYDAEDAAPMRQFVEDGGTLLVADNFGPTTDDPPYGNTLLANMGATTRFDGALLRDEHNYYRSPALPIAQPVSDHPYTRGVSDVTLNYGTAVVPNDAETLVRTSEFAYRDTDQSGSLSGDEELARYPVVTVEAVGDGQVIAVSDPSIFINAMLDREGNSAFVAALAQAHERVIFDYSQSGSQPPVSVALLVLRETPLLQALVGAIGVALGWGVVARPASLTRGRDRLATIVPVGNAGSDASSTHETQQPTPTETELLAYLRAEYPDWDDDRLQRIVADIIAEEPAPTDNE